MAKRKTPKTGLLQARHSDPVVQKQFDGIIERLEVLDGIRGDSLDRAVTFRDLDDSGFGVTGTGGGGGFQVDPPPDSGGGDGDILPGPVAAPTNLAATDVFLAVLLTWDNPSFNLQHIEIHRAAVDNQSLAVLVGVSHAPLWVDYVGASASNYYWVKALSTDGTYSAFNALAGTLGTTGIDPSDFEFELNIAASNLDAALTARIDLIDIDVLQDSLMTRVAAAEGSIVTAQSDIVTLTVDTDAVAVTVSGNSSSISGHATLIAANTTSVTALDGRLITAEGDILDSAAAIVINASSILNLEAALAVFDPSAGQDWQFDADVDGFTANNASLVWGGGQISFSPSGNDPELVSEAIAVDGGLNTQVVVRVKMDVQAGSWEGSLYYSTAGHGFNGSFLKTIADPPLALSEWVTLTFDMSNLSTGGSDWIDNEITGIRLDLTSDTGGTFDIDWIQIAKFSTTALTEAIAALDVRVTANESGVLAQGTDIVALEATVDDPVTGVAITSSALSALTVDVGVIDGAVVANAADITALETTVNGVEGVVANATAIGILETSVSVIDGTTTSQASQIVQLVASMQGGHGSMVNTLTQDDEIYGTSFTTDEMQPFTSLAARTGVAAVVAALNNRNDQVYIADGNRIKVEAGGIYEIRYSVYHARPNDAGTWQMGIQLYEGLAGTSTQSVHYINDRVAGTALNATPSWIQAKNTVGGNAWYDVVSYILGKDVDPSLCPNMTVNGSSANDAGFSVWKDGMHVPITNEDAYMRLRLRNYNESPTWGDDTETSVYWTDLSVRRIDSEASNYAAIQVAANVTADDIGNLNGLYTVQVELNTGGDPYITGFGLSATATAGGDLSSAFGIRADQFFVASPSNVDDTIIPFSVGVTNDGATVGINGQLIVDGTINASAITANSIGAEQIAAIQLSAINADMGTITAGLFRTAPSPAPRLEIEDVTNNVFPFWYGHQAKSADNGRMYAEVDELGNFKGLVIKGLLEAGMIKQTFFAPAGDNQSFRIACDYPNEYSGGLYTGNAAHISPILTAGYSAPEGSFGSIIIADAATALHECGYHTDSLRLFSPTNTNGVEYGRMGSHSEQLMIRYSAVVHNEYSDQSFWMILKYEYNNEGEKQAWIKHQLVGRGGRDSTMVGESVFITRTEAWNKLDIRLGLGAPLVDDTYRGTVGSVNLTIETPNLGYADLTLGANDDGTDPGTDPPGPGHGGGPNR